MNPTAEERKKIEKGMKPLNQQEKCECKVPVECQCGHTPITHCAKCRLPMSAETPPTSPHQEGWAERLDKVLRNSHDAYGTTYPPNPELIAFIRQELTTLHKADCERFRGMIGEDEKEMVEDFQKHKLHDIAARLRNKLRAELRTALSKMEEEEYER